MAANRDLFDSGATRSGEGGARSAPGEGEVEYAALLRGSALRASHLRMTAECAGYSAEIPSFLISAGQ